MEKIDTRGKGNAGDRPKRTSGLVKAVITGVVAGIMGIGALIQGGLPYQEKLPAKAVARVIEINNHRVLKIYRDGTTNDPNIAFKRMKKDGGVVLKYTRALEFPYGGNVQEGDEFTVPKNEYKELNPEKQE